MMNTAPILPARIFQVGLALAILSGCNNGDEDSVGVLVCSDISASAGPDQSIVLGNTVALDGSDSVTCQAGSPAFAWTFESVPTDSSVTDDSLSDNNSPTSYGTSFTPDVAGDYVLSLVTMDRKFDTRSTPDVVVVTVAPGDLPPVADCGGDLDGESGIVTTLDGSGSYDPETHPLDFAWALAGVPDCSSLSTGDLASAGDSKASLVPDCNGYFTVSLVVSDGFQYSSPSYCNVRVATADQLPVADAGTGGIVPPCDGDEIKLNGYSSYDPEGNKLVYAWSVLIVPKGSAATNNNFSDRESPSPTFQWDTEGTYRFQLQVFDGAAWSPPDIVEHVVNGTALNVGPVANAGIDVVVDVESDCTSSSYVYTCPPCAESQITLDGTGSTDANGDAISYHWSEETGGLTLDTPDSAFTYARQAETDATYGVEVQNSYTVYLDVADCLESDQDSVQVVFTCTGTFSP